MPIFMGESCPQPIFAKVRIAEVCRNADRGLPAGPEFRHTLHARPVTLQIRESVEILGVSLDENRQIIGRYRKLDFAMSRPEKFDSYPLEQRIEFLWLIVRALGKPTRLIPHIPHSYFS